MVEIIPAIMPRSMEEIETHIKKVRGFVSSAQIDIMDGVFVPEKNWPYTQMNVFDEITEGTRTLPFVDEILYEIDLMIKNPEKEIESWFKSGARRIIVHFESTDSLQKIIDQTPNNLELGIAIGMETPNEAFASCLEDVAFVQYMGIEKIGYQGEPFSEKVIPKISALREKYPNVIIQIDGGVSLKNASQLIQAGVNRLVSGSAIWKSEDITETIKQFQNS